MSTPSIPEQLQQREPLFQRPELGVTREDLERQLAPAFWEVGASGARYDRSFVIDTVVRRFEEGTEPDTAAWRTSDFACRPLGNDTFALTYLLDQDGRLSRRLTLWQWTQESWQALYHQGTLVSP
jgi:hypothetical protein